MRGTKAILVAAVLTVVVGLGGAASAQVKFNGVGSSALFNGTAVGVFSDICSARVGSDCRHYSVGGKNAANNNNFAQAVDSRNVGIPVESGNLWVVWDNNTSPLSIWAYLSTDSVVGNRCFYATPRCTLQVDSGVLTTAGQHKVPAAIMLNRQTNLTQDDEASLPSAVLAAVQTAFTAALTDIRPEDAKYATNRALAAYNAANLNGLGYGVPSANCPAATSLIGCQIKGTWGGAATPVQFSLSKKKDPFTGVKVPASTTISIGAAPIMFLYNSTGPGLSGGGFTNITYSTAGSLFNGTFGLANQIGGTGANPLNVILREALSGTMNTTEFNTFRVVLAPAFAAPKNSQEKGIDLSTGVCPGLGCPNPLQLPGGGGVRLRAIGTGQMISGNAGVGGIKNLADSVGYAFFSFGNVNPIAGAGGVGRYVTLDGVDPIVSTYTTGVLPLCTAPCPAAANTTYPHIRDGSYRSWSVLRVVTDASGANLTNVQAIVTATQNEVNATVPDFVPAVATTDGDTGLQYLRSHFKLASITSGTIKNSGPENGGDVGGCPFKIGGPNATQINVRLNGAKALATNVPWPGGSCDLTAGHN